VRFSNTVYRYLFHYIPFHNATPFPHTLSLLINNFKFGTLPCAPQPIFTIIICTAVHSIIDVHDNLHVFLAKQVRNSRQPCDTLLRWHVQRARYSFRRFRTYQHCDLQQQLTFTSCLKTSLPFQNHHWPLPSPWHPSHTACVQQKQLHVQSERRHGRSWSSCFGQPSSTLSKMVMHIYYVWMNHVSSQYHLSCHAPPSNCLLTNTAFISWIHIVLEHLYRLENRTLHVWRPEIWYFKTNLLTVIPNTLNSFPHLLSSHFYHKQVTSKGITVHTSMTWSRS